MRPPPLALALALLPAVAGCGDLFGDRDAHQPGEPLGTFHVVGTLGANACGAGALGAGPTWEFDVDLARGSGVLYWDNGAQVITGELAADGLAFAIDATVVVDMRTEEAPGPPCSIQRSDRAEGALDPAEGDQVTGFSGKLAFAFAPTADSECSDLVEGEAPLFAKLPCGLDYALEATRTAAPAE